MSRDDAILNLRQVLIKRLDKLRENLQDDMDLLKKLRATNGDFADAALDSAHDQINSQLVEVESHELVRVEYALERMRNGIYGICEDCGTNIPMARLNAEPCTIYCIACQRKVEHGRLSLQAG